MLRNRTQEIAKGEGIYRIKIAVKNDMGRESKWQKE